MIRNRVASRPNGALKQASRALLLPVLLLASVFGTTAGAWGHEGHRQITVRALDGLPVELAPWFRSARDFVSEHAIDPDLWRVLELESALGPEGPNHFLNIDALDEPPPYTGVPRDRAAFVARYGQARAEAAGRLPWRALDLYARLVAAFRTGARSGSPADVQLLSAVLGHYVEDAFVPFHAVSNHDGQLTKQAGIHSRFESELLRRYRTRLTLPPVKAARVDDVAAFLFAALADSAALAPRVLAADQAARRGRPAYDGPYYAAFFAGVRPVLEERFARSADAVASLILSAWHDAGRPALRNR
jgi:hypothetical protein